MGLERNQADGTRAGYTVDREMAGAISGVGEDEGRSATWELEAEILQGCLRVRPPYYSLDK